MGEICENIVTGGTPSTSKNEYWSHGSIPWMSSGEIHNRKVYSTIKHITELGLKSSSTKYIPRNSVLIALAGQGKTRGCVAINKIDLCINQSLASITPISGILNYTFLYYNLDNRYQELRDISSGDGSRGGLNLQMIKKIKIPLPSLAEQERIVNILDKFDTLVNDISQGLPAEIEARQKQYEYYRNKLLTFKEISY